MTGRACWRGGMGDGGMGFTSLLLALLGQGGGLIWGVVKGKHLPTPQKHRPQVGLRVVPSSKGLPQGLSRGKLCSPFCAPAGFPILVHAFL